MSRRRRKLAEDVSVRWLGSIALLVPRTRRARGWLARNAAAEPWQWIDGGLACEPRMVGDLVEALREDGFGVAS